MEYRAQANFWDALHRKAREKAFPLRVMFELTYRCNFRCGHCYVPRNYKKKFHPEIKTQEVFSILGRLRDSGCFYLGFTGGEPFLRKDIFKILFYAKKKGFQLIIYSNASLIDKEAADRLRDLSPNKLDITIPAMDKDSFERISGLPGSWEKVFKAVDFLYKRKVRLGFKSCILKENSGQIERIRNFAASLGAPLRLDAMLSRRLDGSAEPYQYRAGLVSDVSDAQDNLKDCNLGNFLMGTKGGKQITGNLFRCGTGSCQAAITPSGELKPCLMLDTPRFPILTSSLTKAWQGLKDFSSGVKPDRRYRCNLCRFSRYCKWCPAKSWLYNRTLTSCVPEVRGHAKTTFRFYENRN